MALNSCTDALIIAMPALGIGPSDKVITSPFTFLATAGANSMVGARPVSVDISLKTFNLDPDKLEATLTPNTKGILPVHLYGSPAPMGRIMEIAEAHGLKVVEDCAQSLGACYSRVMRGPSVKCGLSPSSPKKLMGLWRWRTAPHQQPQHA